MESLIDSLDTNKWETIELSDKGDGYKEFHVQRNHIEDPKGTWKYLIQEDEEDAKAVTLSDCIKDPLKSIGTCEIKLDEAGTSIVGVDLNGDLVVKK